jgi:hypothetical protein
MPEALFIKEDLTDIPHNEIFLFRIVLKKPDYRIGQGKIVNHTPS